MTFIVRSLLILIFAYALSLDPNHYYNQYYLQNASGHLEITRINYSTYFLQGDIGYRDCDRVKAAVRREGVRTPTSSPVQILLDSSGGYLHEALCIGEYFKNLKTHTTVSEDFAIYSRNRQLFGTSGMQNSGTCASACMYIFLSGDQRRVIGDVRLGIHNPRISSEVARYIPPDSLQKTSWSYANKLLGYLSKRIHDVKLIRLFFSIPNEQVLWVSPGLLEKNPSYRHLATEYIDFWGYNWKA